MRFKLKYLPFLIGVSGIIGLISCGDTQASLESPQVNQIEKNTKFCIKLPETHDDGYTWQLKEDYNPSVVQRINEVWHGKKKGIYFHLKTRSMGETTLNFVKRNYTDTSDTKHFIIKIAE